MGVGVWWGARHPGKPGNLAICLCELCVNLGPSAYARKLRANIQLPAAIYRWRKHGATYNWFPTLPSLPVTRGSSNTLITEQKWSRLRHGRRLLFDTHAHTYTLSLCTSNSFLFHHFHIRFPRLFHQHILSHSAKGVWNEGEHTASKLLFFFFSCCISDKHFTSSGGVLFSMCQKRIKYT